MTFSPGDRVRVLELDVAGRVADVVAGDPPLQRRRNPPRSSWRIGAASSPRECQVPRCFPLCPSRGHPHSRGEGWNAWIEGSDLNRAEQIGQLAREIQESFGGGV